MGNSPISTFFVRRKPGVFHTGVADCWANGPAGGAGAGGIKANKREGDGGTPARNLPAQAAVVAGRPGSSGQ